MVKTLRFGDIEVPVPGFGAMGFNHGLGTNFTLEQAEPVLLKALELGCTFWDTAVIYGFGVNEKLVGDFIRKHNVRDKVFVASKCGIDMSKTGSNMATPQMTVTNKPSHIGEYIEGTIERLGFTPDFPDDFGPTDGRRGIPKFQGENFYKNRAIVPELQKLAVKKGCTTTQVALAWVAAQGFIAIPGTTKAHRLEENWASRDVELTEAEMAEMRRIVEEAKPQGARYSEALQKMVGH
ncbi:hypothetical protein CHGG_08599 [Chaetomium globosum CBS 148.51]|uniref:NADP-dependent oxidoreductase domain-containing protein n=1 Tax=Chaetomium globosum (strain ATCC 6205 / CBS 148.51 / DSM 1962 / NBRC 6347 / NRRL 1970) TaxID=306901 RepID=Q2GTV5_CHAGB|nr:uncharacterized protein CHGG_08599 [Chaetomium globosum CBS 148.51]EAQ84585.1 hypothetical protein CHGG_08599 [Chaetomium globosum CBS 148.51]